MYTTKEYSIYYANTWPKSSSEKLTLVGVFVVLCDPVPLGHHCEVVILGEYSTWIRPSIYSTAWPYGLNLGIYFRTLYRKLDLKLSLFMLKLFFLKYIQSCWPKKKKKCLCAIREKKENFKGYAKMSHNPRMRVDSDIHFFSSSFS